MKTFFMKRHLYYVLSFRRGAGFVEIPIPLMLQTVHQTDLFLSSAVVRILYKFHSHPSLLLTVTTPSTPASEITTLSLQSNTNVPSPTVASSSLPSAIDVTTTATSSVRRADDSLKVLALNTNKTDSLNDKDDSSMAVTPSTQSPMTVNLFDTKIKPEAIRTEGTLERFVNNGSDNQANQPQTELVAGAGTDERSRLRQEKEGRAINFPLGVSGNHQDSTASGHLPGAINFVTTSTEKAHVMSFFDLSDVSMDHDDTTNERREMEAKGMKTTTDKQQTAGLAISNGCAHNGTSYKVSRGGKP